MESWMIDKKESFRSNVCEGRRGRRTWFENEMGSERDFETRTKSHAAHKRNFLRRWRRKQLPIILTSHKSQLICCRAGCFIFVIVMAESLPLLSLQKLAFSKSLFRQLNATKKVLCKFAVWLIATLSLHPPYFIREMVKRELIKGKLNEWTVQKECPKPPSLLKRFWKIKLIKGSF